MDKSKYRDGLRAVRKYIPKLEQDLQLLRVQAKDFFENRTASAEVIEGTEIGTKDSKGSSNFQMKNSDKLKEILDGDGAFSEYDSSMETDMASDSEGLSDIFETDCDIETEDKVERPLYLDAFEKFPVESNREPEDFEEHLRQISRDSRNVKSSLEDSEIPNFDEVDQMFMRAASLLKKRRR